MTLTHKDAQRKMQTARNRAYGKPLQRNTRLYDTADGGFAIRFHATDVVTVNPDGTFTLRNGGWRSVTTLERIRGYSPMTWRTLITESGDWYVRLKPNPRDPEPTEVRRTIPKPFQCPEDPGPEPVKTDTGWTSREDVARDDMTCIAGSSTAEPYAEYKRLYEWRHMDNDVASPGIYVSQRYYSDGSGPYKAAHVAGIERVFYGEAGRGYYDDWWIVLTGKPRWSAGEHATINGNTVDYKQCPHCAAFDALHTRWSFIYNGDYTTRDRGTGMVRGYRLWHEMVAKFGSVEAWQDAYITEFRARRAYNKAQREWEQRNRVPFFDGITVDSDGYAPRLRATGPSPAKLRRHEAASVKMRKRIDTYVKGFLKALNKGMPNPGNGDCWFCLMRTNVDGNGEHVKPGTGVTWGDMGDHDHLLTHVSERYYVPTLAVNALLERGYQPVGVYLHLGLNPDTGMMGEGRESVDTVRRDLTKYLRKRLMPAAPTE